LNLLKIHSTEQRQCAGFHPEKKIGGEVGVAVSRTLPPPLTELRKLGVFCGLSNALKNNSTWGLLITCIAAQKK
jgi:hypothetical protein